VKVYEDFIKIQPSPLVYIHYQRFARRAQGVDAARNVFKRARSDPSRTYHIYVAHALLEFHANKEPIVARKIFELGMKDKDFSLEADYIIAYIDFLVHTSDDNNMRVLFERSLDALKEKPPSVSRPIWDYFLDFEYRMAKGGGDLSAVEKIEKRRAEALSSYGELSGLAGISHRYEHIGLLPDSETDKTFYEREVPRSFRSFIESGSSASNRYRSPGPTSIQRIPAFLQVTSAFWYYEIV
jgi:cleavage stimulation factor subunit 3